MIGAKGKVDTLDESAAQKELSANLESIIGELGGSTDVSKLMQAMGLGDS